MKGYYVYMHVNKTNGKRYIGITCNSPKSRWKRGTGYAKQKRFFSAIKSYGWDGFDHFILFEGLSKEEAEKKEAELIEEYQSNDLRYGYNIENGGVTNKLSDEQKEHLREVNLGKKHSAETKRKMSKSHKGMSTAWLTGIKVSEETKRKHSVAISGAHNPRAKKVYQYDLDGNLVAEYDYMDMVKEAMNINTTGHISQCCRGERGKAYGYMWSYNLQDMKPYARLWKGGVIHG